jgi:hypothetical protein
LVRVLPVRQHTYQGREGGALPDVSGTFSGEAIRFSIQIAALQRFFLFELERRPCPATGGLRMRRRSWPTTDGGPRMNATVWPEDLVMMPIRGQRWRGCWG